MMKLTILLRKKLRDIVYDIQQKLIKGAKYGVVMDGRDIATQIMPDADLKVFMSRKKAVRKRRW